MKNLEKLNTNLSKSNMSLVAQSIVDEVKNGEESALSVFIKAKTIIETLTMVQDEIKEHAIQEASEYHKDDSTMMGVKFSTKGGTKKYNYTDDPEYTELLAKLKEREELLKRATINSERGSVTINESTGEQVPPVSVQLYSNSLTLKYKK